MPNNNFSMPGPQFGSGSNEQSASGWFKSNWRKIAAALAIVILASGAIYFYKNYQARKDLLRPDINNLTSVSPSPVNSAIANIKGSISNMPEVKQNGNEIVATAAKGNGATHLARQALKKYLKNKPDLAQKLRAEQRIFIEDYLQKHASGRPKTLHPGEQITFSDNDFQTAINQALALSSGQINNLSKYVPLVHSLMVN